MVETNKEIEINRRNSLIGAVSVGLITLVVYTRTLCPTLYVGDSGELVAAAWNLGVPHSPGYPLFTVLGYLFSHIPFGDNPAVRMNFMTALFGALSVVMLYRLTTLVTKEYMISFITSLIFAFGIINWSQSVTTEVYTLNNFIVCVALYFIILASLDERKAYLYAAAYFSGLALTTHQTSLLILPAGLWLLIQTGRLPLKGKKSVWLYTFIFYILGFSFYAYLPLAASQDPVINWGDPSNASNLYKTLFAPAFTQVNNGYFFDHIRYLFHIFFRELFIFGAIFSIVGLVSAFGVRSNKILKFLSICALTYILFFLFTLKPVFNNLYKLDVYYLPVFMICSLFIAVGIKYILENTPSKGNFTKQGLTPIIIALLLLSVSMNLIGNFNVNDRSDNRLAEWYGRNILESCDDNSILLCNFDDLFILFYMQEVLGVRKDVTTVLAHFPTRGEKGFWKDWLYEKAYNDPSLKWESARGLISMNIGVEEIIEAFIDDNIAQRPVFMSFYKMPPLELLEINYRFVPEMFVYRLSKTGQNIDVIKTNHARFKAEYDEEFFQNLFNEHHNVEEDFVLVRCDEIFRFNATLLKEVDETQRALDFMTLSTAVNPLLWMNWSTRANLEERSGDIDGAFSSIDKIIEHEFIIERVITPTILDWRYEQAKIYHRAGRDLEAAVILNQFYHMDRRQPKEIKALAKEIEKTLQENEE